MLARQAQLGIENRRMLLRTQAEATTDALTGLGNRRALVEDLERAASAATADGSQTWLALYDLDGFKAYNDAFGHGAGDGLLQRLGAALQRAAGEHARAYRMGGDEFCLLIPGSGTDAPATVSAGSAALSDSGRGFSITASHGVVRLPEDAEDAAEALRRVDQLMYADKSARTAGVRRGSGSAAAILQIVRERNPELGQHTRGVADWAAQVAAHLGADAATLEQARLGGELHDIGKTAIPDAILDKPGALTPAEWEFMRRHTVIGERILLADGTLAAVAPVARSHHERWDGGGYPDGLRGPEIPLVARIVAVCDAVEAMTAVRPYRPPRSLADALAELDRLAGAQFDPDVVTAFRAVIGDEHGVAADELVLAPAALVDSRALLAVPGEAP